MDENLIMLYEEVLVKCEAKLNPIRLVKIAEQVAKQYLHSTPPSTAQIEKSMAFMERFSQKVCGEKSNVG